MTHALFDLESDECGQYSHAYADTVARTQHEFARFYARYQPRLLRYARRVWGVRDAEEIAQETFARAFESIDLTRDERSLWGWLVVVGRNVAADLARARRVCDVGGEHHPHESTADPKGVEQSVLDSECLSTLGLALSALPPSQSRACWLSVVEGMTPAGIAESLACSPEAVRQALFRGRKRLAAAMADFCDRTSALAIPVVLLLRRGSDRVSRTVAPAAANGFLSAAMITTGALTATIGLGGASAPLVAAHPGMPTNAVEARPLTQVPSAAVSGAPAATRTRMRSAAAAPMSRSATSPIDARTHVSSTPLAPGEIAHEHIFVDTPIGKVGTDQVQTRADGEGLVCGRVKQVHCQ